MFEGVSPFMSVRRFQWAAAGERYSLSQVLSAWVIESWQKVSSRASRALSKTCKHDRGFPPARSPSCPPTLHSPERH
jgi:hypothetical protein